MKKKDRKKVFDKTGGHCAYCGQLLGNGWHVDEMLPCRRKWEYVNGKKVYTGYTHPERLTIENQWPACASCNINKHSMSVEDFRKAITTFMKHLNEISTQYKIAKRYGLVTETLKPIIFYFETINHEHR